jgi:hypothetical protein
MTGPRKDLTELAPMTWMMLAALLALVQDLCGDDTKAALRLSHTLRGPRGRKKLEAYMRDPRNRTKIIAKHREAADMLGLNGQIRH